MGIALEELIERHGLYVATDLDHTYQHSANCYNSGKSTIDLILVELTTSLLKQVKINIIKTRPGPNLDLLCIRPSDAALFLEIMQIFF